MRANETERTSRRGIALTMGAFEALGFAFREQSESDYGIDGHAELIDDGRPTGQLLGVQVKAGESYLAERTATEITFRADADHVNYWLNHALPVIICICDVDKGVVYWQVVNSETAVSTGKRYRVDVPLSQSLGSASLTCLFDLLTPLVSHERYTIVKTNDVSHGLAKRYSFSVVINGTASKAEIASIVRQVTVDGAKRRYHRNHMVEGRWGDADAHVVWTYVYPSAQDEARSNHICRSQWVDESLASENRPLIMEGENVGGDVVIEWSENYKLLAQIGASNTLTKETYLNTVSPWIDEMRPLLETIGAGLLSLKAGEVTEDAFMAMCGNALNRIREINMLFGNLQCAPFECKRLDDCLAGVIASIDNIALYYSSGATEKWSAKNRLELALQQRLQAIEGLGELAYEIRRARE